MEQPKYFSADIRSFLTATAVVHYWYNAAKNLDDFWNSEHPFCNSEQYESPASETVQHWLSVTHGDFFAILTVSITMSSGSMTFIVLASIAFLEVRVSLHFEMIGQNK